MSQALTWEKLGLVFVTSRDCPFPATHAQTPTAYLMRDRIRVFVAVRPPADSAGNYAARVIFVDLDRRNPTRIIGVSTTPVLSLGDVGAFDEFGAMPMSAVHRPDLGELWLYFTGWSRKTSVPYDTMIGLAISDDGGESFHRKFTGPVLGPAPNEPFLLNGPLVKPAANGWRMWYAAGVAWIGDGPNSEPVYRLAEATSPDGVIWENRRAAIMPTRLELEAQSMPALLRRGNLWHLLFSYRPGVGFRRAEAGYRIGCATSPDLSVWTRNDDIAGLTPSPKGWDSQSISYTSIVEDDGTVWAFYCGNYFGIEGFGVARLFS